jgi:hypothetical protein
MQDHRQKRLNKHGTTVEIDKRIPEKKTIK